MNNCTQTIILASSTPDDLQNNLNERLIPLGDNVKGISIFSSKKEFMACVTYEAEDINTTMNKKISALDPGEDPDEAVFVCVMNNSERQLADYLIRKMAAMLEGWSEDEEIKDEKLKETYKELSEKANKLLSRFSD